MSMNINSGLVSLFFKSNFSAYWVIMYFYDTQYETQRVIYLRLQTILFCNLIFTRMNFVAHEYVHGTI